MDEALAFVGETGPYIQNGVVRARNIFAKLEAEGHAVADAARAGRTPSTSDPFLEGEEGDEVWSLLLLMARSEEVGRAGRARRGGGAPGQARLRGGAGLPLLLPEARSTRCCTRESDDLRAFRVLVVDAFLRQMEVLAGLLGIPIPERM